jgi:hypothetical protein
LDGKTRLREAFRVPVAAGAQGDHLMEANGIAARQRQRRLPVEHRIEIRRLGYPPEFLIELVAQPALLFEVNARLFGSIDPPPRPKPPLDGSALSLLSSEVELISPLDETEPPALAAK